LPRARGEGGQVPFFELKASAKPANPPPPHRSVVLVVEDNDAVRDVAATMIADLGVETLTASNGSEALHILETRKDIDLVLSDVIMAGGMNGPELAARALKMRPELKLLFMSGYAPGSVRQMQNLPDAIDLVNKPFTRTDLTSKVMRALAA
jgi:CheY-like chemotaxis protein